MSRSTVRIRLAAAALLGALAVAGLAGCTASGGSSASSAGGSAGSAGLAARGSSSKAAGQATDRSVITTATLDLVAKDPIAAAGRIQTIVAAAQGTVQRSTEDPSGSATANLVVRVPADGFSAALRRIQQEGQVRSVHVDTADVTGKVTDTATRIANLRTSIARLQKLLANAGSTADLVTIESTLTERQSSLETLLGQQKVLADQVASATLTVGIVEPAAVPRTGPSNFLTGFAAGLDGLARTAAGTAVVLGLIAPWVLVLAALGGAAVLVTQAVRRRLTSRAAGTAG
jgi:hypothetical protein